MRQSLEIKDRDSSNILDVSLADILELLTVKYQRFVWRVFELEAVGDGLLHVQEVAERAESLSQGLRLEWDFLTRLAAHTSQTINLLLVAAKDKGTFQAPPCDREFYEAYPLVIECIDSTLWKLTTSDQELSRRVLRRFREASEVPLPNA